MIAAAALALLLRQKPVSPPTLPPGTAPEFARLALAIEGKLAEGDVAGARALGQGLPVREPRLAWVDDAGLPAALRAERTWAVGRAAASWSLVAKGFAPKEVADGPEMTVGFTDTLPDGPDGIPLATRIEPGSPFHATIGLHRGKPGAPIRIEDLTVELAYAMGRYLGVPEAPLPGSAMHRDARPNLRPMFPLYADTAAAAGNLNLADRLRAGIEAGKPIGLNVPTVQLPKARLDLGNVRQGQPLQTRLEIENVGAGTMEYRIEPDCNCFRPFLPGHVASQGRTSVPVDIDTLSYMGRQDKVLLLLTNDPARSQIEIPVSFYSLPAYRLFRPGGPNLVVPDAGGAYDVFLYSDPKFPIHPTGYRWDGIEGTVKMSPWSGKLADPEMKEGPILRKGWRFRVRISPSQDRGQLPGTLVVTTDSPQFSTLMYAMTAQKGIVADSVYLGDVKAGTRASFLVSRPNAPFKILGVDSGKLFKATWQEHRSGGWEYQVDLDYVGGASKGDLLVPIRIRTNDPKQPLVETLVSGNVR